MIFLGIAAFYVAAAVGFYSYLMATAVDESELLAASHRRWRRAHPFHSVRLRRSRRPVVVHWRPVPRPVPIRATGGRPLGWRYH